MTVQRAEPFVGLRPYRERDSDRFFGRIRETFELTSLLVSSRLVIVYGAAGVGKTSLLQAGVLAYLRPDMAQVLPAVDLRHVSGVRRAPPANNPWVRRLLSAWAEDRTGDLAEGLTVAGFLEGVEPRLDRYQEVELPLVAVIDQFDVVFNAGPEWAAHREDLLIQLADAVANIDRLHLVLSMSQDVVGELLPHEQKLSPNRRRRYRVEPLTREAALEAVTMPMRTSGRSFAPGVAETLVDRLRTTTFTNELGEQHTVVADKVEPIHLQLACTALWRGLPEEVAVISGEHLEGYGDLEATLTSFCVLAVIDVAAEHGVPESTLWEWLDKTFITDLGTRGVAHEGLRWTGRMPNAVARAFEQRRILRSEKRSGSVWFELLHDGLIQPIKRGWRLAEGLATVGTARTRQEAYLAMARIALEDDMVPLAEEYAQDAVRASERDPRTLAEANSFLGMLVLDKSRKETGQSAEELYQAAEGHYRRAAELFETGQNSRAVGRVLASLGRLYLEWGRFADAVGALLGAASRLPGDRKIRRDLAQAWIGTGQPQAAVGVYTAGLVYVADDERVDLLVGRATVSAAHGDPASAIRDLDDVIGQLPELADRPDVVSARSQALARLEQS